MVNVRLTRVEVMELDDEGLQPYHVWVWNLDENIELANFQLNTLTGDLTTTDIQEALGREDLTWV